jgi:hypothetical protein
MPRGLSAYVAAQEEKRRRAAKAYDCPACGAPCLRGDDHDRVSMIATTDAGPLAGVVDEMLAHFDGLETYSLVRGDLYQRQPWQRTHGHPIHAEHRCRKAAP